MSPSSSIYPPGHSPFHTRGSTYSNMRSYVDERVSGGLRAVCAHLPDSDLREFVSQVFLPVSHYDAMPIHPFAEAIARAEGIPYDEAVRRRALRAAQRDISVLYKLLLKVVSPELVVSSLQRLSLRYFDFGKAEVLSTSRGRSEGRMSGIPEPLSTWLSLMIAGYAVEALRVAGAAAPRARVDPPVRDGERGGIVTITLHYHFAWS